LLFTVLMSIAVHNASSQEGNDTLVYLLTCGAGTETYSIYGHSALRIVYAEKKQDLVYNWGVFDFETPNFAWKFAKGRLDYMLAVEKIQSFLQVYILKEICLLQRLNLSETETAKLISLVMKICSLKILNTGMTFSMMIARPG